MEVHLSLKQTQVECHSEDTTLPTTKENIIKECLINICETPDTYIML